MLCKLDALTFICFSDSTPPVLYLFSGTEVRAVEFYETLSYKSNSTLMSRQNNIYRADLLYSEDELVFSKFQSSRLWK